MNNWNTFFSLCSGTKGLNRVMCVTVTHFFIIKPTRCTNFTNLFWHGTLYVLDSSSVHQQEFIHCTLSNGICHTAFEQDGTTVPSWSCSKVVCHIPLLSVQWIKKFVTITVTPSFCRPTVPCTQYASSHSTNNQHVSIAPPS